jgi:hypothetical protein
MACLDVFSHVVEHIFLLQQNNVIHQALLDSWEESNNPCTIFTLLMVPLNTLQVTYGRTYDTWPLSNAYKHGLLSSKTCMTIATAKLPGLITTSLILPHPFLTAIACHLHIFMNGCPQCSHYAIVLMLLHVIVSLWSHKSLPMMGRRSQEYSTVLNTFLRNHTTFMKT